MKEPPSNSKDIISDFADGKIKRVNVYLEGVGIIFVSRSKDGIIAGFIDPSLKGAEDDHVTFLLNPDYTLKSFHRQIANAKESYYLHGEASYLESPNGLHKMLQDQQTAKNTPFYMKSLLLLIYYLLQWGATLSKDSKVEILDESIARKMGLDSPCLNIRAPTFKKLGMTLLVRSFKWQYAMMRQFKKEPISAYRPLNIPGSKGTIRKRRKKPSQRCAVNKKLGKTRIMLAVISPRYD